MIVKIPKELQSYVEGNTNCRVTSKGAINVLSYSNTNSIVAAWVSDSSDDSEEPVVLYSKKRIKSLIGEDMYYSIANRFCCSEYSLNVNKLKKKWMYYAPTTLVTEFLYDREKNKYFIKYGYNSMYSVPRSKVFAIKPETMEAWDKSVINIKELADEYATNSSEAVRNKLKSEFSNNITIMESVRGEPSKLWPQLDAIVDSAIDKAVRKNKRSTH